MSSEVKKKKKSDRWFEHSAEFEKFMLNMKPVICVFSDVNEIKF